MFFASAALMPGDALQSSGAEAVFTSTPTALTQSSTTPESVSSSRFCGQIVLILPHADGLGVDLHQLRQRILQPPRDGNSAAQVHVVVGELLCGELAGGVDRRARLVDDHVVTARRRADAEHLSGHLLRLAGGCAVADGDVLNAVLADECRRVCAMASAFLPLR